MLEVSDGDLGRKHLENGENEKHLKLDIESPKEIKQSVWKSRDKILKQFSFSLEIFPCAFESAQ